MNKFFKELGFKAGDAVVCLNSSLVSGYKRGDEFTLKEVDCKIVTDDVNEWNGCYGDWKLKEKDMFEDQWHLNDGKVEIPGDADKLEKDGSVVAFRKRKAKPFEFGEKLRIKKSLWSPSVFERRDANPGFDYVNAVYLSKYFGLEGEEGIRVYINNGENGWECCLTGLDKVERLT